MSKVIEGKDTDGNLVRLYPTKGDLTVRQFADPKGAVPRKTTHFSHHPFAVQRFEELTGQQPEGLNVTYEKVKGWPNKETDGHEHDWEWDNPDDDDDEGIHCGLCGIAGELDDEEE